MQRPFVLTAVFTVTALIMLACSSHGNSPVLPGDTTSPNNIRAGTDTTQLMGFWNLYFDEEKLEIQIEPVRASQAHFNITNQLLPPNCYNCIVINVLDFDPLTRIAEAEVTLTNPYNVAGHDVRGIVYTNESGTMLLNDDAWTGYFDIPGGQIINPFRFFDMYPADHSFPAFSMQSKLFRIYFPPQPHDPLKYAVTVSYPGNCDEPYSITNFQQDQLLSPDAGSSATCTVEVRDWQNDVNKVLLNAPEITGDAYVEFTHVTGPTWTLDVVNNEGVFAGEYKVRIAAYSENSGTVETNKYVIMTIGSDPSQAGWARTWGNKHDDYCFDVDVDDSGNSYVVGHFEGTVDFDPGPLTDYRVSNGEFEAFLTKLDPNGLYQWTKTWGGNYHDQAMGVKIDESGDIFVSSTVDEFFTTLSRLDQDGNEIWTREWANTCVRGIAMSTEYIYVSGIFSGTVDFDPGSGEDNKTYEESLIGSFVSCCDKSGNYLWTYTWNGAGTSYMFSICADSDGNLYATNYFFDEVDFEYGPGEDIHVSNGNTDAYLLKVNSNGEYAWTKTWGSHNGELGNTVATDTNNNIYVGGRFGDTCDFDPSGNTNNITTDNGNAFLSRFDPNGDYIDTWTWGAGDGSAQCYRLDIDDAGNIYVAGDFHKTADFDPGTGVTEFTSNGQRDTFISKFDSSMNFLWARSWGGLNTDWPYAIAADNNGVSYVVGGFNNWVSFNPNGPSEEIECQGGYDSFINKILADGTW